ncbi:WD40/YVTN/BNR-like repeat-containing protein [Spirosoma telluris]|uniref:WD40/YVTN/BNR-like repeat-containing protein n=1 Tax=Spirosoma telluris TaxID=2183553 RepID=UPI0018DCF569
MGIYHLAFLFLFQCSYAFNQALEFPLASPLSDSQQKQKRNKAGAANIIYKSTDGGQTWQDISEGLPEGLQGDGFFATNSGFYLQAENGLYHNNPNAIAPFWEKESFPNQYSSIAPGKTG